ncbi:hypothetical protein AB1E18_001776 [Capra hircus]
MRNGQEPGTGRRHGEHASSSSSTRRDEALDDADTKTKPQQFLLLLFPSPLPRSSKRGRMEVSHSVKERTISENSLIILLQGLQGQVTTVDLRDESVAHGRIDNVDAFMNIRLAQVTYTDRWGHQVELDDLFVTGRNVRYVHIPDNVNITATIEQQLQVIHRVRYFGSKGQGRQEFPSKNS